MIVIILPVHPEIVLLECTLPNALFVLTESSQCFIVELDLEIQVSPDVCFQKSQLA